MKVTLVAIEIIRRRTNRRENKGILTPCNADWELRRFNGRGEDGRPAGASQLKTDSDFQAASRRALQNASEREFRFLKSNLMAVGKRASYC
jgi:hypothetical protein